MGQSIGKDRKFWKKSWRRLREDPFFSKKKEENLWGNEVPDTWPVDDEDEAKLMYDEQVKNFGCPFQSLPAGPNLKFIMWAGYTVGKSCLQGAQTTIYLALCDPSQIIAKSNGHFFS